MEIDAIKAILTFTQENGLFVSTFIAAIAYLFKIRRESKQDLRHALFVLLQLRIALNKSVKSLDKHGEAQIRHMFDRLKEFGLPVDEQQMLDEMRGASSFHDQLNGAFFELDSNVFKNTVVNAATALSQNHPFLANRIVYMSKLPDAIEALNEYVQRQKKRIAVQRDESVSEEVSENTRVVAERALTEEAEKTISELVLEVDEELRKLAWSSGFAHWYKVRRLQRYWCKLDQQPTKEEADKFTDRKLSEIVSGVTVLEGKNKSEAEHE